MEATLAGKPSFAHIHFILRAGEGLIAEPDAMASMDTGVEIDTRLNGKPLAALAKWLLGGESLFINYLQNEALERQRLTITQSYPGDIHQIELENESICLQPGAFICCSTGLELSASYAGFASFIARAGLFKQVVRGSGTLYFGAFGGIVEKQVEDVYIVDSGHLLAYEPHLRLKTQLSGKIFSSIFGKEGLVTKIEGTGRIILQTRSLKGIVGWLNPLLPS